MHIVYLHGFASSVHSTKGTFLAKKFRERGMAVHMPDFNEPEFTTLTVTRMVEQVERVLDALPAGAITLIGSSLGGFVAVQVALRRKVDRLVLLAPALDFDGKRMHEIGDRSVTEWQETGELNVFHYGFGRIVPVHYGLYTDVCGYDCVNATLSMPILIFQGRRDTAVSSEVVERWASSRPNVELHLLDDDHQLGGSLDYIWTTTRDWLSIVPSGASND
jgi:pimeloyl-ACP methyl ester carboxylesterase